MPFDTPVEPPMDAANGSTPSSAEPSLEPAPATDTTAAPSELEALQQQHAQLQDQHLRLAADFDNFRKRRLHEMEQQRRYGAEPTLQALLPVLDNLERAQASLTEATEPKLLLSSVNLLAQSLHQALEPLGLKAAQVVGEAFNPALHEAVGQLPSPTVPEGHIMAQQLVGYTLQDKVLRPAQVIVSSGPAAAATPSETQEGDS